MSPLLHPGVALQGWVTGMAVTFDGSVFNENDPLISGIDMHTDALAPPRSRSSDKATAIHPGDIMEIFIWELRILIRTQGRVPTPPTLPPTRGRDGRDCRFFQ